MSAENKKIDLFGATTTEKAKVAIVGMVDQRPSILLLTRSVLEDTRVGEDDWAGGKLNLGEMSIDALLRETGEELPGAMLRYITELRTHRKTRRGEEVITHLFAATAEFPDGDIKLSEEHSGAVWVPLDEFPDRTIPNKYKDAVASASGLLIVQGLALLGENEPLPDIAAPALYITEPVLELAAA